MRTTLLAAALAALVVSGCARMRALPSPGTAFSRTPTTEIDHPLGPQARIDDHATRLADGVARYREATGGRMPQSQRDLALQMATDGMPCFTEVLKDHWFQPYAYMVTDEASGRFALVSAGADGLLGDGDDLRADRGPGDPRVRTYGFTWHPGE